MKALLFVLSFLSLSFVWWHPVYMSRTEIDYRPQGQALEISIKIFADDLQAALSKQYNQTIEIGTDREHLQATTYIQAYLKEHFALWVNDKAVTYEYVGREIDDSDFFSVWVYLQVKNTTSLKSLRVHNSILHDYIDAQDNIVIIDVGNGYSHRMSLRKDNPMQEIMF